MVRQVDAIFTRGALRPLEPLALPEGTRVHLNIEVQLAAGTSPPAPDPAVAARQLAALESFTAGMTSWTARNLPPGHVVEDSRARIYVGRGG